MVSSLPSLTVWAVSSAHEATHHGLTYTMLEATLKFKQINCNNLSTINILGDISYAKFSTEHN